MDIDLTKDGARSSIDFQKIIENIKLNQGEEIQYLGTSIGSPYENQGKSKYKKIDINQVNKNTEINFSNNHNNSKSNKHSILYKFNSINKFNKNSKLGNLKNKNNGKNHKNHKIEKEKLMQQANNLNKNLNVKSIFKHNPIKENLKNLIGKNFNKTEINNNSINPNKLSNSTLEGLNKINNNNNKNSNSIFKSELDIYAKNIQFKGNNVNLNGQNKNNKNNVFDDMQINYLQTKKENLINSASNINHQNHFNNQINGFYNNAAAQKFNSGPLNNFQNPNQLSEMNRLANSNYEFIKNNNPNLSNLNGFNGYNNNQNLNDFSNIPSRNLYLPNSNNNQNIIPNNNIINNNNYYNNNLSQNFPSNSLNNKNNIINNPKNTKSKPIIAELTNIDLSEDNPLNREIRKRLEKIKKLEMLNNSKSFDEKNIRDSESILNNYENDNSESTHILFRINSK
jgi:hypothetical protein